MILISKFFNTYIFKKSIKTLPIIIMQRHTFVYKTRFCSRHKNRLYRDIPTFFFIYASNLCVCQTFFPRPKHFMASLISVSKDWVCAYCVCNLNWVLSDYYIPRIFISPILKSSCWLPYLYYLTIIVIVC